MEGHCSYIFFCENYIIILKEAMKYIALTIRKRNYKIAECDIKRIFVKPIQKRPSLPAYDNDFIKMGSPALTQADIENIP